jgi:TFIIF-interacting CTD phosphatase-like protein
VWVGVVSLDDIATLGKHTEQYHHHTNVHPRFRNWTNSDGKDTRLKNRIFQPKFESFKAVSDHIAATKEPL